MKKDKIIFLKGYKSDFELTEELDWGAQVQKLFLQIYPVIVVYGRYDMIWEIKNLFQNKAHVMSLFCIFFADS